MPELPEVETVRRGLAAGDGGRPLRHGGAAPRPTCGSRSRRDFADRLTGQTVDGARPARQISAWRTSSSGDVLVMHLGMSGLVPGARRGGRERRPANSTIPAPRTAATTTWCSRCRPAHRRLQRPAPLRLHEARSARRASTASRISRGWDRSRSATPSTRRCWRGLFAGKKTLAEGGAAGPARGRGARQHLCLRGAVSRASLAERLAATLATKAGRADRARRTAGRGDPRRAATRRSRPAARRCATTARPPANSAISSIASRSTTARASRAAPRAAAGW